MALICKRKSKGVTCDSCEFYQYASDYGDKVCVESLYRHYHNIVPGKDAVFTPGKIHGAIDFAYIIYANECANEGNGSFEIERVDSERILDLYNDVDGDAEAFFDELPDRFQGEWGYCDNTPESKETFDWYTNEYFNADFIVGRDGGIKEEMEFLVNWARSVER